MVFSRLPISAFYKNSIKTTYQHLRTGLPNRGTPVLALWTCMLVMMAMNATAQEETDETESEELDVVLEEIIVTAQKRQETLQDTPVSITAMSESMIEARGLTSIDDLTKIAPNVSITKVAGGTDASTVRIRGLSNAELILTSDPKSTVYIDGVLIAKSVGSLMDVVDLERIEVLRGPQGTLFGRNAVGGAISLITKKPGHEWDFAHTFEVGNESMFNTKTMINAPIIDNDSSLLAARLMLMSRDVDGWVENEKGVQGVEHGRFLDQQRRGGHFALYYSSENWAIDYSADRSRWRDTAPPPWLELVGDASTGIELIAPTVIANYLAAQGRSETEFEDFICDGRCETVPTEFVGDVELDIEGHSITVEREFAELDYFGDVTFKSITAYREMRNLSVTELDGTPVPHMRSDSPYRQQYQSTQEFQLYGNTWEERLDYVIGLFYFQESGGEHSIITTLDTGLMPAFGIIDTVYAFDNDAWALYGQITIADVVIDSLALTLGVRYTEETRGFDVKRASTTLLGVDDPNTGVCDPADGSYSPADCVAFDLQGLEEDYDNVSPMANISYPWTEDMMSYFRIATGYQSGGFNGRAQNIKTAQIPYDEETLVSYELGTKSSWADNRVTINGALFYSENEDLQVPQFPVSGGASVGTVVVNAGESTLQGGEIEMVLLASPSMTIYLNYAYLKAEYDEYIVGKDANGNDIDTARGREFRQAPENTISAGFEYDFGTYRYGDLTMRLDTYWQDDIFLNDAPAIPAPFNFDSQTDRDVNQQEAYGLMDLRLTLDNIPLTSSGKVKISLWGKNLGDKEYRYGSVDLIEQLGFASAHYGDPRTYGLSFTYDYGDD